MNRVARGEQVVTVWKDARELGRAAAAFAMQMVGGAKLSALPGATTWTGGTKKLPLTAVFLKPLPITADKL